MLGSWFVFKFGSGFGVRELAAQGPVFDRTGLSGEFDFVLEYDETGVLRPTMVTAIREQLGLRLQPARAPIDVIIVERAVQPSAK